MKMIVSICSNFCKHINSPAEVGIEQIEISWILWLISVSDGDHEKVSKKELLLLGRRKEKKDKKDRGYATLDGESSEEDFETK